MGMIESDKYAGLDCVKLSNGMLTLRVTSSLGPRVISLSAKGGENLFAVLPEKKFTHEDGRVYSFIGGHRFWIAPETPEITYLPDDDPVKIKEIDNGISITQRANQKNGFQKFLDIQFSDSDRNIIYLDHRVRNIGAKPIRLAAWAITQFLPGGIGILPMETEPADENSFLPNRRLIFWPYSDLTSNLITLGDTYVLIKAQFEDGAFKVGYPNPKGWIAYLNNSTLFVKRAVYEPSQSYFDFESSSECYCNQHFLELETLSPIHYLDPGESVSHLETWEIYENVIVSMVDLKNQIIITEQLKGLGIIE